MTAGEMKNEFLIHYNAIATSSAPSLDDYEISVYLTKAQLELVKDYYNPDGNKYKDGFESSEKRRADLRELVQNSIISTISTSTTKGISPDSKFPTLSDDVFLIIQESITISSTDSCLNKKQIDVKPITHDEYNKQKKNPFKRPSLEYAWRLDISKLGSTKVVEIVTPYTISSYNLRYVKYPDPIITSTLTTAFPSEGLSIDGQTVQSDCKLDKETHREIIDRAVELALRDYKPSGLESKIQLDSRNE